MIYAKRQENNKGGGANVCTAVRPPGGDAAAPLWGLTG